MQYRLSCIVLCTAFAAIVICPRPRHFCIILLDGIVSIAQPVTGTHMHGFSLLVFLRIALRIPAAVYCLSNAITPARLLTAVLFRNKHIASNDTEILVLQCCSQR
jgi:hypothetical protein